MPQQDGHNSRMLLCEGADGAEYPVIRYVRQGNRAFFFEGAPSQLHESLGDVQLVESVESLELVEREVNGKKIKTVRDGAFIVEGPFQRSDVQNANKRVYPRKLWERLIGDDKSPVQETVRGRAMHGQIEHPENGKDDLGKAAILTTHLKLQEDGTVWGRAELLDTEPGLHLQALTMAKVRWGVSSRGSGSVDAKGVVNESDYTLSTFDAVSRPSTPGAHPKVLSSASETAGDSVSTEKNESNDVTATLSEAVANLVAVSLDESDSNFRIRFARQLLTAMGNVDSAVQAKQVAPLTALELHAKLRSRLAAIQTVAEAEEERELDQLFEGIADTDDRQVAESSVDEARSQVIATLSERVRRLQKRVKRQQRAMAQAQQCAAEAEERALTAEAEAEEAWRFLSDSESALAEAESKLEAARETFADTTAEYVPSPVEEALDEAVLQNPELEAFRQELAQASTTEHLYQLIESVTPRQRLTESEGVPPVSVLTLPRGSVVSESIPAGRGDRVNVSRGAKLAARAVQRNP